MNSTFVLPIETAAGVFTASFSAKGLAELNFPGRSLVECTTGCSIPTMWLRVTTNAVLSALRGKPPRRLAQLDFAGATAFQRRVWDALMQIPPGETRSYAEIARHVGSPKAARAVGAACGANPIPLLIPCHRVLAAGKQLGGFSGGLEWKEKLLKLEGSWPVPQ